MENLKKAVNFALIFTFGGIFYGLIEIIYRGRTHYSMVIAGGICFAVIVAIDNRFSGKISLFTISIMSSAAITVVELLFGIIFNIWLKMNVWDYSAAPLNLLGQVCLPFSLAWIAVSAGAILFNRHIFKYALII